MPGFPEAHTEGETMDQLATNLTEIIEMLLEEGEPKSAAAFIGFAPNSGKKPKATLGAGKFLAFVIFAPAIIVVLPIKPV